MTDGNSNVIEPGAIVNEDDYLWSSHNDNLLSAESWLQSIDVILLLGGGVPLSPTAPPTYVQRRCDLVAKIIYQLRSSSSSKEVDVICLSAGTAHLPQYILPNSGLPLWESTASAAYLINHTHYPVNSDHVYVETTSYDTISNAFFARTTMIDIHSQQQHNDGSTTNETKLTKKSWRNILVVTNEFHIGRTKAIFDWIFNAPSSSTSSSSAYKMYYLSCNNVGLDNEALAVRKAHEVRGEANVRLHLAPTYPTIQDVWTFLVTKHDFYCSTKLVEQSSVSSIQDTGNNCNSSSSNAILKLSYGKTTTTAGDDNHIGDDGDKKSKALQYVNGKIVLRIDTSTLIATLSLLTIFAIVQKKR
jgi:uncharacterized SAM-binding protein YcdF (DUF218 family)